jgi:hypothetical protein
VLLSIAGYLVWDWRYTGDPSAGDVRDALAEIVDGRCSDDVEVRKVEDIGGPGLPDGMLRARDIVCDDEVFAAQYVFRSHDSADEWVNVGRDRALVEGRTVVERANLTDGQWERLLAAVED